VVELFKMVLGNYKMCIMKQLLHNIDHLRATPKGYVNLDAKIHDLAIV
jgi:hypothetical protein